MHSIPHPASRIKIYFKRAHYFVKRQGAVEAREAVEQHAPVLAGATAGSAPRAAAGAARHDPLLSRRGRGRRYGKGGGLVGAKNRKPSLTALSSVAGTDVEVLAVDQRFLQRVQRRYPRIASKVFLNLTGVLSDRLERTTQHAVAATTEDRDADPAPAACWPAGRRRVRQRRPCAASRSRILASVIRR
jgi:hypothetical protein